MKYAPKLHGFLSTISWSPPDAVSSNLSIVSSNAISHFDFLKLCAISLMLFLWWENRYSTNDRVQCIIWIWFTYAAIAL